MATFSFFLRRFLWIAAGFLLVWTLLGDSEVLGVVLFALVVMAAIGYRWLDDEAFGEYLHRYTIFAPPKVEEVHDVQHHAYQDTLYHKDTPTTLVRLLEDLRRKNTPVRISYGDPETGLEERSVTGYINCSSGAVRIPLLAQSAGRGGVALIDHCIVQVRDLEHDYVLYQHPTYYRLETATEPLV